MPNARILLVDDDAACLDATTTVLSFWGYAADIAKDSATALSLENRQSYDFLITDFELPDMNGIELFLRIRQSQPDIKGILVTGALTEKRRFDATTAEMLADLQKSQNALQQILTLLDLHYRIH